MWKSWYPSQQVNGKAMVCDCTHYCYAPEFWRREFFPALQQALGNNSSSTE